MKIYILGAVIIWMLFAGFAFLGKGSGFLGLIIVLPIICSWFFVIGKILHD